MIAIAASSDQPIWRKMGGQVYLPQCCVSSILRHAFHGYTHLSVAMAWRCSIWIDMRRSKLQGAED